MKIGIALPTSGTVSRGDTLLLARAIEEQGARQSRSGRGRASEFPTVRARPSLKGWTPLSKYHRASVLPVR